MHIIEINLLPLAVYAPVPSVTSSIMNLLCLNILYMWGELKSHGLKQYFQEHFDRSSMMKLESLEFPCIVNFLQLLFSV